MTKLAAYGPAGRPLLDTVRAVYAEVYAEPPYLEDQDDVNEFAASWDRCVDSPGFRLVIAHADGDPAGFTFGYPLKADTSWWRDITPPLPEDLTREGDGRTFAIIELAVRKPFRRQGIARQLHQELLAGTVAERVTLAVRPEPEAAPAQAAYASWGYQKLGQSRPKPDAPIYDVMLRPTRRA